MRAFRSPGHLTVVSLDPDTNATTVDHVLDDGTDPTAQAIEFLRTVEDRDGHGLVVVFRGALNCERTDDGRLLVPVRSISEV